MDNKPLTPKKFIFTYVIPMFVVALVLVFLSYTNQARVNSAQEQVEILASQLSQKETELKSFEDKYSSLSALFSKVLNDNAETQDTVDDKEAEIEKLKAELDELGEKLEEVSMELEATKALLSKNK